MERTFSQDEIGILAFHRRCAFGLYHRSSLGSHGLSRHERRAYSIRAVAS